MKPIVWSISGSDSSAGAGIQADLRAFDAMEVHGCTAIAAITAQHSVGVERVEPVATDVLDAQLAALAVDMPPRAIKLGMLGSVSNARCIANWVDRLRERAPVALVIDPVWRATTGADLSDAAMRDVMRGELLPRATVVTPNRAEAAWLLGRSIDSIDAPEAAAALRELGSPAVVVTGGDSGGDRSADWMDTPEAAGWLGLPRIATSHHHGSGCVFASSMAAAFALGFCAADAAVIAKMSTAAALHEAEAFGSAARGAGAVRPVRGFGLRPDLLPWLRDDRYGDQYDDSQDREPGFADLSEPDMGLYAIVDNVDAIERLIAAGVCTLQLRIKDPSQPGLVDDIARSVRVSREGGAQLFINDHWQLAIDHGAYGVHLGQEDLARADLGAIRRAGLRLGISTHSFWEVCRAVAHAPSYIACGPIHATATKAMPWIPQGPANLAYWCAVVGRPVVAIAGMDAARSAEAVRCGAAGIAVLRGFADVRRMAGNVVELRSAIQNASAMGRLSPPRLPKATYSGGFSTR